MPDQADPLANDQGCPAALYDWLSRQTQVAGTLTATRITGGRSNLTYLLHDDGRPRWVLRRPPDGDILPGAHDVEREYRIIEALVDSDVPVPEAVGCDNEARILGVPFAVTGFVPGLTLRDPVDLAPMTANGRAQLTSNFATNLALLHGVDPTVSGRDPATGRDHIARQLYVWRRQVYASPGRDLPNLHRVGEELARLAPDQHQVSIVHGDYRLDNVRTTVDGQIMALLDWELWTLGDPLADLGSALAYWVEADDDLVPLGTSPTTAPDLGDRDDIVEGYVRARGIELDAADVEYFLAFGTWRFAAILEGVYQRHLTGAYGEVADDSWRSFEHVVPALADRAAAHLTKRSV